MAKIATIKKTIRTDWAYFKHYMMSTALNLQEKHLTVLVEPYSREISLV